MRETKEPRDIYQDVTNHIVAAIEAGVGEARLPWQRMPHAALSPKNINTGKAYSGVNFLTLAVAAMAHSYPTAVWGTYRQLQDSGAQVRQGEKGTVIIFYKSYETDPDPENADDDGKRRVARSSVVFNISQTEGYEPPDMPDRPLQKTQHAEAFFHATGAKVLMCGDQAYYSKPTDHIQMPDERLFDGGTEEERANAWFSVRAHEEIHWTGAKHRLDRNLTGRFGSEAYACEKLVAEIGAGMVLAHLGLSAQPRLDHACYVANWLKVLKNDKKAIFSAAARAQEAVTYLIGLQPAAVADAA